MNNVAQLNNLVQEYQETKSDDTFRQIYENVSVNWRGLEVVGKSVKASKPEIIAAYEDTLLRCIDSWKPTEDFEKFLKLSIRRKRCDIYRKKKRLSEFEFYIEQKENEDGSTAATYDLADDFLVEDYITAKKKADQRQLIDSLLNGADETTTAIVEAFLAHPKPTATAIAKELGYHHSKVTRALNRLAGKFSTKQFGDYHDYLIAL